MGPFVQVVLGQIISLFGNAALRFVLPLILLRQTGSAAVYGAATALALLPALAGTLAGGVLADRCRKARLMVVLDLAAAGLALGAAASADNLPTVLWAPAALCALYALQGLYQPVVRASLPLLLAGDRLVQGNAVIQLVDTLDELLGPLLGSVLLGVMGLGPLLVLCGACFAASALLEWQIRIPGDRPQPTPTVRPAGPGASAGHCRAVRRHGGCALGTTACLRRGGPVRLWGDGRRHAVQCVVLCPAAGGAAAGTAGPGDRLYNGAGQPDPAGGAGRVRGTVRCVFRLSGRGAAGGRCRVGGVSDRRNAP